MTEPLTADLQREIARALGVVPVADPLREAERRVAFLAEQVRAAGARTLVLGISGGVDSTTAGRLCRLAVDRLRADGYPAAFCAMRLPYGVQADEEDAQRAVAFIEADELLTVDIKPATDAALDALLAAGLTFTDHAHEDFVRGNVKARQRMVVQYAAAGANGGLVVGTDHAAEAAVGFFTKFGDGAADVMPLSGLTKRQVRSLAEALGAPAELVKKTPTADLENLAPGRPDEDALGVTYDALDDFLEGRPVAEDTVTTVLGHYRRTEHKRGLPIVPGRA
ncbi:NH(3)-dependent NAD(+) synthetase [Streptomyces sp. 1114.5]|uniref:ammonia-dependent NAD(+) synthetase n=1 Tax=unclassified Streptomyces TaxID=2593676 RepID=UPI000BD26963|nr:MULTISPECIES: ammonia-dependent NAD(+) synthetase [unclassified Streptomyces]RKT12134.1 NH(3)-dependent NAD(+) synthetase [Streptomyces sp. 1114.5]SOB79817.1 NH(3)-dependent NAD(+) synthetase [Streptomyces sp. 1331.2]